MAFLFQDQNQGIRIDVARAKTQASRPFSFIRTLTVGFGITPNLLTLPRIEEGARGLGLRHPYRRWGLSPRPENIGCPDGQPAGKYDQTPTWEQVPPAWGFVISPMCPQRVSW